LHVDEVPLTTKMIEAADKIDCKRNWKEGELILFQ
jgi:hypothetical protein